MSTLNVSLTEDLRAVVEEQVGTGKFSSHSEYVRSLIRQDQERIARERLEATLLERLGDGESVEMDAADWKAIREEFFRRAGKPKVRQRRKSVKGNK
ncbi:MAG: addiction module antidote protein family [Phycisphaerales bacterium]|jgi:antitoxin ParD1/3/4|nr:addiction module antidote protein family [Phycisphaerales bacterium]MDB5357216.1 addiction module antidote protein family [Phycisphaerales bacterium]